MVQDQVYIPTDRADVDSTGIKQRKRKHADGKKVRKANDQGVFEYIVYVVSAEYDTANHCWRYTLNDFEGKPIAGTTVEDKLD
ncbi:MAG: hypothetical protein Q9166_005851 [cf. Caloplaca sp. 2 TL-2023]